MLISLGFSIYVKTEPSLLYVIRLGSEIEPLTKYAGPSQVSLSFKARVYEKNLVKVRI